MADWKELFENKVFISDLGEEQPVELNGQTTRIRYAVWSPVKGCDNHQIIDIGTDLEALMEKYKVSFDRVCVLVDG